eukprot:1459445-Amphidinium_carterae.1
MTQSLCNVLLCDPTAILTEILLTPIAVIAIITVSPRLTRRSMEKPSALTNPWMLTTQPLLSEFTVLIVHLVHNNVSDIDLSQKLQWHDCHHTRTDSSLNGLPTYGA